MTPEQHAKARAERERVKQLRATHRLNRKHAVVGMSARRDDPTNFRPLSECHEIPLVVCDVPEAAGIDSGERRYLANLMSELAAEKLKCEYAAYIWLGQRTTWLTCQCWFTTPSHVRYRAAEGLEGIARHVVRTYLQKQADEAEQYRVEDQREGA